jgi:hypothetical protein
MPTNPNMVAIQTVTVGAGGASSIDFTSIPQTYTDLVIRVSTRSTDSGDNAFGLRFNGSSTAAYSMRRLWGNGSGAFSGSSTSVNNMEGILGVNPSGSTASTFGNVEIYIPNYTSSNNKSVSIDAVNENNATTAYAELYAGLWSNTSAITQVTLGYMTGNFVQYSTATLYGVTSAAVGAKATGGIISQDNTYWYHTFTASGTFTPTSNITADYLVVAGGGGGGNADGTTYNGGGGGAGGLRCTVTATGGGGTLESPISLTASTAYTITIGAGGTSNTPGENSSILGTGLTTITSIGGGRGKGANSSADGGSGGGGSATSRAGGSRTTNQGYDGGASTTGSDSGGGGGGAGAVGTAGASTGGNGGAGVTTSISGSSVTYAGGGGGGAATPGSGGLGGGGAGGNPTGTAGTANSGGGGGGVRDNVGGQFRSGAAGGSGIVILRYAK